MGRKKGSGTGLNTKDTNEPIRDKKVGFQKSSKGNKSCRVGLPQTWLNKLGVTEENPLIDVFFENDSIVIRAKEIEK